MTKKIPSHAVDGNMISNLYRIHVARESAFGHVVCHVELITADV